ncbi:MAG TPA: 4-hydroxy-tetrahydrodipicolinate synthase [Bacillota bacterium]
MEMRVDNMTFLPKGIIVPVVTPFADDGSINYAVYRKVLNHLIENGVHGVFPLGTTGEFYAVSDDEYQRLLETTVEEVRGRISIYAGVNHITTRGVIRLANICARVSGIDAISVLTPMFISQSQEELYQYYKHIAESTDFPIVMYNNKPKTNVTIEPDTVARLAEIPNIVGVKDSTGDFTNTCEYIRLTRGNQNFGVLLGRDTLIFAGLCQGAVGAISSCANVAPRLVVDIYDRFMAGDLEGAREAQFTLNPLRIACNMGTFPAVIKEGLVQQGFPVGKCLDPISELSAAQKQRLKAILKQMES